MYVVRVIAFWGQDEYVERFVRVDSLNRVVEHYKFMAPVRVPFVADYGRGERCRDKMMYDLVNRQLTVALERVEYPVRSDALLVRILLASTIALLSYGLIQMFW